MYANLIQDYLPAVI